MTTVSYRPTLFLFVYMELVKNGWNDFLYLFFLYIYFSLWGGGGVDNFFNFIWTIILKSESEKIKNVGESFKRVYFYVRLKTNIFYFPVHGQKLCKTFQKLEISHMEFLIFFIQMAVYRRKNKLMSLLELGGCRFVIRTDQGSVAPIS